MPTTPLVLLAAWCFARSSKRFHRWLLEHRIFGPYVSAWEEHRIIPLRVKIFATAMILPMTAYMLFGSAAPVWGKILASALVVWGLFFIWTKPSRPQVRDTERGQLVDVVTRRGRVRCRAMYSRQVRRNAIWMPFHFPDARTNYLTTDAGDEVTGTGEYKVCAARLEAVKESKAEKVFPGSFAAVG